MSAFTILRLSLPSLIVVMAISLSFSAVPNLIIQKACSPDQPPSINDFICNDTQVLSEVSVLVTTKNTIKSACTAVSTLVMGRWRDLSGRSRPLLLVGTLGEMVTTSAYFYAAVDWGSSPWLAAMAEAVFGGLLSEGMSLGTNCLVIAKTPAQQRTTMLQVFMIPMLVAALVSSSTSGFLVTFVGYAWLFAIMIFLLFFALLSIPILVRDDVVEGVRREKITTKEQVKRVFSWRPNVTVIWLMMLCGAIVNNVFTAESSLSLYFYQQKFHFTLKESALFGTYHFAVAIVGSVFTTILMKKILKWSDFKFAVASSLLAAISSVSTALASTRTMLIASAVLSITRLNLYSIPQSILSRCIKEEELGMFIGIGSITGLFIPSAMNYTYYLLFSFTSKTMPGAFYFISAACYLLALLLFSAGSCIYVEQEALEDEPNEDCQPILDQETENVIDSEDQGS